MAAEQFANNAQSSLTAALTAGATSLTVANASAFPASGNFRLLIDSEILLVTAVSGNTCTASRGQEGTTAAVHAAGTYATHVLTAGALANCPRSMTAAGDLEYLAGSGAVTRLGLGSAGQVLTVSGGLPSWQAAAGGGGDMLAAFVNAETALGDASGNAAYATLVTVKPTAAGRTVTLPAPALSGGKPQVCALRVDPAATKLCTLAPHGAEKIDGAAASQVLWAGEAAVLETDGTDWFYLVKRQKPMVVAISLSASQGVIGAGTETLVALDTVVTDNTGLMADTANHRLVVQRTGKYVVTGVVAFSGSADGSAGVSGNSGAEANLLDNAAAGGAVLPGGQAKNSCLSGTNDASIVTALASLTAGHYVALEGYMGADNWYALVSSPAGCALSIVEVV